MGARVKLLLRAKMCNSDVVGASDHCRAGICASPLRTHFEFQKGDASYQNPMTIMSFLVVKIGIQFSSLGLILDMNQNTRDN